MVPDHRFEIEIDRNFFFHGLEHLDCSDAWVLVRVTCRRFCFVADLVEDSLVVHVADHFAVQNVCFSSDNWVRESFLVLRFAITVYEQVIVDR